MPTSRPAARAAAMLLWGAVGLAAAAPAVQIGDRVDGLELADAFGRKHSLEEYRAAGRVVVLEFWSYKCPVSLAYDRRVADLAARFGDRGVDVLAVASNANESAEEVRRNALNLGLRHPVLLDADGELADRLGASHTPSIYILDAEGVLRYRGSFDNNREPGSPDRQAHAEMALEAILAGRTVREPETPAFGCGIRRRSF